MLNTFLKMANQARMTTIILSSQHCTEVLASPLEKRNGITSIKFEMEEVKLSLDSISDIVLIVASQRAVSTLYPKFCLNVETNDPTHAV